MSNDGYWFAPKRYGYGAGLPIAWQGWVLMAAFLVVAIGAGLAFGEQPVKLAAILVPAIVILLVVSASKTRGGWRWRWGEKE